MPNIRLLTGLQGTGKTFRRAACWLPDVWLPQYRGRFITNLPINAEAIADWCLDRYGLPREETLARIVYLPPSVTADWRAGRNMPWEMWPDPVAGSGVEHPLAGCYMSLDEFHRIVPRGAPSKRIAEWAEWVTTTRQRGFQLELITQDQYNVAPSVLNVAEVWEDMVSYSNVRDPFFHLPQAEWWLLYGAIRPGAKAPDVVYAVEAVKVRGKWKETDYSETFRLDPARYHLYNSYAFAGREGKPTDDAPTTRRGCLWRFWRRNWAALLWSGRWIALAVFVVAGLCSGWLGQYVTRVSIATCLQAVRPTAEGVASAGNGVAAPAGGIPVAPPSGPYAPAPVGPPPVVDAGRLARAVSGVEPLRPLDWTAPATVTGLTRTGVRCSDGTTWRVGQRRAGVTLHECNARAGSAIDDLGNVYGVGSSLPYGVPGDWEP